MEIVYHTGQEKTTDMEKKKSNSRAKNTRCPFREECERKCAYEFKELQCDYYRNNAYGDMVIPEQEQLRAMQEKADAKLRRAMMRPPVHTYQV